MHAGVFCLVSCTNDLQTTCKLQTVCSYRGGSRRGFLPFTNDLQTTYKPQTNCKLVPKRCTRLSPAPGYCRRVRCLQTGYQGSYSETETDTGGHVLGHMGLFGVIWEHSGLLGVVLAHLGSLGVIGRHLRSLGVIRDDWGIFGVITGRSGSFAIT